MKIAHRMGKMTQAEKWAGTDGSLVEFEGMLTRGDRDESGRYFGLFSVRQISYHSSVALLRAKLKFLFNT